MDVDVKAVPVESSAATCRVFEAAEGRREF
jgi:hypothetical protein